MDINGEPATREKMLMALADVDSILIRATYWTTQLSTSLSDFSMDTLSETTLTNEPALEVEQCTCPRGYVGTSCEVSLILARKHPNQKLFKLNTKDYA